MSFENFLVAILGLIWVGLLIWSLATQNWAVFIFCLVLLAIVILLISGG